MGFLHTLAIGEFAHDGLPMDPRSFNGRREKEVEKNTTLAKYTAVPTTIILWILSCLWMKPITAGVLKAVAPYINDARKHLFR